MLKHIFSSTRNEAELLLTLAPIQKRCCMACGGEFKLTKEQHYVARDPRQSGLLPSESVEYDAYDCIHCGTQIITGFRKPRKE